ncbi:NUDIX domain-containing protein [Marinomonas sp. TI.3.20]|uniref:NUDIX domain-containing protein n=1 Tax=Marinomonas sp. TI.3.20 TaxID=3121296 RepID=UPI00311DE08C
MKCSCLINIEKEQVLLVKPVDKNCWYFPGGKVENGENYSEALIREVREELGVSLNICDIEKKITLEVPTHDYSSLFTLCCFVTNGEIEPSALSEIESINWFSIFNDLVGGAPVAPAVIIVLREFGYDI